MHPGLLRLAFLIAIACVPGGARAQVPLSGGPARQVSACRYLVTSSGIDKLNDLSSAVLDRAVEQARDNGGVIAIHVRWPRFTGFGVVDDWIATLQKELNRTHAPLERVWRLSILPGRSVPDAVVTSCSQAPNDVCKSLPSHADMDTPIQTWLGRALLTIPLRYLSSAYWRDIPFEPMSAGDEMLFELGWPGLIDHAATVAAGCARKAVAGTEPASRVLLYLQQSSTGRSRSAAEAVPRRTRSVRGDVYGARFVVSMHDLERGYFRTDNQSGPRLTGWCDWGNAAHFEKVPTAEEVMEALGSAKITTCRLADFRIADALIGTAVFSGRLFPDWRAIHSSLTDLISSFQPASSRG